MGEKLAIIGSTGSIGKNTLRVVEEHPEEFSIVSLAAGTNVTEMVQQVKKFRPKVVSMADRKAAQAVQAEVGSLTKVIWGEEGLLEVATHPDATYLVSTLVGSVGLSPTLSAIQAGKKIGLANKETLVMAGHIVIEEARKQNVPILPIDSEHSALYQCLHGERREDARKLILTASGGAFRDYTRQQLENVTKEKALQHPNWSMGQKITIDTATLMNKGLEVIEAHWLFSFPYEQIEVVVHPQSVIHSLVEYQDGSVLAQLGTPDMRVPIQYALTYPNRLPLSATPLDLVALSRLDFREPDRNRFPCLSLAFAAGKEGGTMTTVLNAANEVAVARFLKDEIPFLGIEKLVSSTCEAHNSIAAPDLEEIQWADQWARDYANQLRG